MEMSDLAQPVQTSSDGEAFNASSEPASTAQLPSPPQEEQTQARPSPSTPPSPPQIQTEAPSQTTPNQSIEPAPAPLTREPTAPAIGPSSDQPISHPGTTAPSDTEKSLTLTLLLTNGARHPYIINEKYLKKRNVNVENGNPVEMSIYTLKELIWREWREEWEVRPSSPSSIRLIYAGGMPGDSLRLSECKFQLGPTPHVVHMTVKPQDFIDEEEAQKGGTRGREGMERSPGCRCCTIM